MPVNEKILFESFQYLFSLKSIIYAILSSAMLRKNHAVFGGKKYRFPRGRGINIRFRLKYRPLLTDPEHCPEHTTFYNVVNFVRGRKKNFLFDFFFISYDNKFRSWLDYC
jgi:hypothetical protein